ncbi:Transamidase GatB domain protein [invertebrate metagenome]|uniref:Transamidase GatB domain protein n=1 Tax=invertebrate metagenome TaxID=1711999 RepID=A0A484H9T2_9ZZZZ
MVRLILTALKDRDMAARGDGNIEGISEAEISQILQEMIQQRRESIAFYVRGGQLDLVRQEQEEISIIGRFLPRQLSEHEMTAAIDTVIGNLAAHGLKDIGRVTATLRTRYAGRMDFVRASALVRERLSS